MADSISLELQCREAFGRKARLLRKEGIIPVHLYGPGIEPRSLQCENRTLVRTLTAAGGASPVSITISGEEGDYLAFVREIQRDSVVGGILHVDFLYTEASQIVTAEVPVELIGESPGARTVSGMVVHLARTVRVEALPLDLPRSFQFDLVALGEPHDVLRAGDLPIPVNATLISNPTTLIAQIEASRTAEEAVTEVDAPDVEVDGG